VREKVGDEEPLYAVVDVVNRVRGDAVPMQSPLAEKGEIFKNAPAVKGHFFKVASILE